MVEVKNLGLDINQKDFAEKMGVGEPLISMYMTGRRTVSIPFLKRFCEVYGFDYAEMLKEDREPEADKLSDRDLIAMFLRVADTQTEILKDIRNGMARAETQATIQETVKKLDEKSKEIGTNLIRTLAVVESARIVQDRSQIELLDHLRKLKAGKDLPSQDEGTRSRRKNGDGQKRGKSPA